MVASGSRVRTGGIRLRRSLVLIALTLLLVVGGAIVFLRVRFHGPALASTLEDMLNERIRGEISIETIDWPTSSLPKVVTGGWVPFTFHNVDVRDEHGDVILHVDRITCELDLHALMFGNNDLVFRDVVLDTGYVVLAEVPEPYPLHAYDTTVVNLFAAFYGERKPGFYAGRFADSPPIFDIQGFALRDIDVELRLGVEASADGALAHAFVVNARDVDGAGFLYTDPSDPLVPKVYFSIPSSAEPLRAEEAVVTVLDDYQFHLSTLELRRLAQLPMRWPRDPVANNLDLAVTAKSVDGADVTLAGTLIEYFDSPYGGTFDLHATITNAGAMAKRSIDSGMGGDRLMIAADVTGPILYPTIAARLRDLEYSLELRELRRPLKLFLDEVTVDIDLATEEGRLHKAVGRVDQEPEDGVVEVRAKFGLSPYNLDAEIDITRPLEMKEWLPEAMTSAFGSQVKGGFSAHGDQSLTLQVDDLHLQLGRLHLRDGTLYARDEFTRFELDHVVADAGDTTIAVDGEFLAADERFRLQVDLDSGDLDHWLRRFGLPPLAKRARARRLRAEGTLDAPTADGTIDLGGVPVIDDFSTTFSYGDAALTIHRGHSRGIGAIDARGRIDLTGEPRAERLVITGRGLDLGKLPVPTGLASGTVDVDATISGPLDDRVRVDATLRSDEINVLGQRASRLRACLNHDPDDPICREAAELTGDEAAACTGDAARGGQCLLAGFARADGGTATVVAHTDARGGLGGRVAIDELPIDAIAALAGTGQLPAGGTAALTVDLGGTLGAPTADGSIAMLRTWLFGAYLGDERFEVRVAATDDPRVECAADRPPPVRTSTGKLAVCGELKDGRVVVAAVLGTSGNFPVRAAVDLQRLEIDPLVDLSALLGTTTPLRAWASGTILLETELLGARPPLDVRLELPEVAMIVPRVDDDGRPAPLVVSTKPGTPLSLRYDGTNAVLGRPVTFLTPAGELTVAGRVAGEALDLTVDGSLLLGDVQPFVATLFDHAEGRVTVTGTVRGTLAAPEVDGRIDLTNVLLRPAGQDTEIRVARARLDHTAQRGLTVTSMTIAVVDPSSGERAELAVKGGVGFEGLEVARWGLIIEGGLSGQMLRAFAPSELTEGSGVAQLEMSILGPGDDPTFGGDLTFDRKGRFAVKPRGLAREIVFYGGAIQFTEEEIYLDDVAGSIDDDGFVDRVNGEITLEDGAPVGGDITLYAEAIPFRSPRTLDLSLSASPLRLAWGDDVDQDGDVDMEITGRVAIENGAYIRDFNFLDDVVRPEAPSGASRPFWEEYPLLGNADLDLDIQARQLKVDNNVANIVLEGDVRLTGSPRDPRLDGSIDVRSGTFKLPGTRAKFTDTRGSVSFNAFSRFPQDTPTLDIASEADFRDTSGQDHQIMLALRGPLSRLTWDLTTSSGLNKGQTFALIISGRAQEDAQRANDLVAVDPGRVDPTTNPTGNYADQIVKDLAGDFISLLVEDPLRDVALLDVARIEVGTGSIGFHGERKVYSNTQVVGDLEQTVRGRTLNVRMEIKSTIGLTVQLGWLNKDYDDPAEEDVTDREAKLVYRIVVP